MQKTFNRIRSASTLRKLGILVGLVGLDAAILLGAPYASIASGAAVAAGAFIADKIAEMKERGELKDKSHYFLWKLRELSNA